MTREAILVLEDGAIFPGEHFGAELETEGEVVFNTSMTGYLEVCTDPSYRGQMVAMCYPQIGNYGVAASHRESTRPWIVALLVREVAEKPHHWEAQGELGSYLAEFGVPGIQGLDTRALVRRLRARGAQRAVLRLAGLHGFQASDLNGLRRQAAAVTGLSEKALVGEVSGAGGSAQIQSMDLLEQSVDVSKAGPSDSLRNPPRVVVIDYGLKHNIVRSLTRRGVANTVLPWTASIEEVLAVRPEGVVLSNGPGDPATLGDAARVVYGLIDSGLPVFGICLGHQLLGLAIGATTSRLPYGHHGGNHPVQNLLTGRISITTQNHEFQVDEGPALDSAGFQVSHRNLNDGSIEGLAHRELPVFSVQYHPEGCPGPQDSQALFDAFVGLVEKQAKTDDIRLRRGNS